EGRKPGVKILEDQNILRFVISDLCREVLEDERPPIPCKVYRTITNNDCEWVKREKLYFTIVYSEKNGNAILHLSINGKYAAGFVEDPKNGGYRNMEIQFQQYLEDYADVVVRRITKILTTAKP
ncbi:MAG: hypothetical protein AAFO82_20445, partial [Bacteroidota bacterium]